jgi:hypothetical protein
MAVLRRVFMQSFIVVTGETVVELGTAWKSCPSHGHVAKSVA